MENAYIKKLLKLFRYLIRSYTCHFKGKMGPSLKYVKKSGRKLR